MGGTDGGGTGRISPPPRRPDRRQRRGTGQGGMPRYGDAGGKLAPACHLARRHQFPQLCRSGDGASGARLVLARHREPGDPHARRAGPHHHPVECALHALHLEMRAGAGGGQHGDPEARRLVAAFGQPAGGFDRSGGLSRRRVQHRAGPRRGTGQCADQRPAHQAHQLHGQRPHRARHRQGGGGKHRPLHGGTGG